MQIIENILEVQKQQNSKLDKLKNQTHFIPLARLMQRKIGYRGKNARYYREIRI